MFKINPNPTFAVAVPLTVPGLPEPLEVTFTFRHKTRDALRAWVESGRGKDEIALLHELIEGWAGVFDDAGAPVPYSLTALNNLVGGYWAAQEEISDAYLRELKESKTKNSVRLRGA